MTYCMIAVTFLCKTLQTVRDFGYKCINLSASFICNWIHSNIRCVSVFSQLGYKINPTNPMIQQNRGGVFAGEDQAQQHITS